MDDEFKLCWKNFQDNIASGFQNLYDRGDLVDVTLACDGKLLHAHKIVLAICSPYFQEIFITNPCKHPIIILKDVNFNIMCELLEFMYQGVVNVKHTELQSFMKIGQLLHIKGLATNSSAESTLSEKTFHKTENPNDVAAAHAHTDTSNNAQTTSDVSRCDRESSISTAKAPLIGSTVSPASSPSLTTNQQKKDSPENFLVQELQSSVNLKRQAESDPDVPSSFYTKKQYRRIGSHQSDHQITDQNDESDRGLEHVNSEDFFLSTIPHIAMTEPRYDLGNVKREDSSENSATIGSMRNSFASSFGFEYNVYKANSEANMGADYSNELNLANDCSKNFGNHMDIPSSSSNVTMLSSTSLLHGSCVFNRNNTVATQQGMKTYWLCKSYRISMCRARCITHQGRVISATGVHNHPPHMRKGPPISASGYFSDGTPMVPSLPTNSHPSNISANSMPPVAAQPGGANMNNSTAACFSNLRLSSQAPANMFQSNQPLQHLQPMSPSATPTSHLQPQNLGPPHSNSMMPQHTSVPSTNMLNSLQGSQCSSLAMATHSNSSVIQSAMHNVNNMLHLPTAILHAPYRCDHSVHHQSLNPNLVITSAASMPLINNTACGPSNLSKHPQQRIDLSESASSGRTIKSPSCANQGSNGGSCTSSHLTEQMVLVNNAAASPTDIQTSLRAVDRSEPSPSPSTCDTRCAGPTHDQITESVTICPGSENSFKIENM